MQNNMENLTFNEQTFFEEVSAQALNEGVADKAAFDEYIEQAVRNDERWGELDSDNDLEGIETQLKARWPEYQAMLEKRVA